MFVMAINCIKACSLSIILTCSLLSSNLLAQNEEDSEIYTDSVSSQKVENLFPSTPKKYPSLLWEISGNGLKKSSYLYGTMHVSRKLAFHLSDTFFKALFAADVVALESNANQWIDEIAKDGYQPFSYQDFYSRYYREESWYDDAFSFKYPKNSQFEYMIRREEQLADAMMYRKDDESGNYSENTFLDMFIHQAGMKLGKTVTGLEDYETSNEMVSKAYDETEEDRANKKKEKKKRIDYYSSEGVYQQIEDAYRKGDLDLLDSLETLTAPSKTFLKWMLWERNKVMANSIDSIVKLGKVIFAGVGCAHVPGDSGMVEILRRMGYTVRPVSGKTSKWADKQKEKIEAMHFKHDMKSYTSRFGDFQAAMPGIPIDFQISNAREYFFPDMANGAYYSLMKMPYYGAFDGNTPEFMLQRIDSLLFENIPGKILIKKRITKSGFPAIDIINKTSQGDYQHQLIIATPTYLWFVKMAGQGEFVKKFGENFFNSINILEKPFNKWTNYSPENNEYTINWPGEVKISRSTRDTSKLLMNHFDIDAIDNLGNYYLIQKEFQYSNTSYGIFEEDSFDLSELTKAMSKKIDGKILQFRLTNVSSYPACETTIKNGKNNSYLHLKYVKKGFMFFMIGCKSQNEVWPADFMNSFALLKPKFHKSFSWQTDSVRNFSTYTIEIENFGKPKNEYSRGRRYYGYYESDEEVKDSFSILEDSHYDWYSFGGSNAIALSYFRENWFNKKDILDTVKSRLNRQYLESQVIIFEQSQTHKKGWDILKFITTDTNTSIRALDIFYVKGRISYKMSTYYDSAVGLDEFATNFIDSFTPFDTFTYWPNAYASKGDTLLNGIFSADSVLRKLHRKIAKNCYECFEKEHAPQLIATIKMLNGTKETSLKNSLIYDLSKLKHPEVIPFLKELYYKAEDTAEMQIRILSALTGNATMEASKTFINLIIEETPLSENNYNNVFSFYEDSLKYAKPLIPEIFELLRYPEYREDVLDLAARLIDSGIIDSSQIFPYKKSLTIEFRDEIKRTKANETKSQSRYYYQDDEDDEYDNQERYGNNNYSQKSESLYKKSKGYYSNSSYSTSYRGGYSYRESSYSNDKYLFKGNASDGKFNYTLKYLATLLKDFSAEPELSKRYNKLIQTNHRPSKFNWLIFLIENKFQVEDSIIHQLMKRADYQYGLSLLLKNNNKSHLIPDSILNNKEVFAETFIRFRDISYKDSLVRLGYRDMHDGFDSGRVYFFKHKHYSAYYEDDWFIDFVWVPLNKPLDLTEPRYWMMNRIFDNNKPAEEQIENCYLIIKNRNRNYWEPPSVERKGGYYSYW